MIDLKNAQVIIPIEYFKNEIRNIIREEINAKREKEQHEQFYSPEEACKMFKPTISKPTLESYVRQGLIIKHYLGGRTWFRLSDLNVALSKIKKFAHKQLV